jgi:hypothetical protein
MESNFTLQKMMKNNWIVFNKQKGVEYHLEIKEEEKAVISWETTGHWRSETGNRISFDVFLKGDWDNWIIKTFGEQILIEAKEVAQSL